MEKVTLLAKLFGSEARVRLMRLFLVNPTEIFDAETTGRRVHLSKAALRKDIQMLLGIGFLRKGARTVHFDLSRDGKKSKRKKIQGFMLTREFPYMEELTSLLASKIPYARERLLGGLKSAGKVNLLVIAGCLLGHETNHVDMFLVGDELKKSKIENVLGSIEAETGKEIIWAFMPTKEFQYRYGMQDRFIKDLFDNPHELLINKLGLG